MRPAWNRPLIPRAGDARFQNAGDTANGRRTPMRLSGPVPPAACDVRAARLRLGRHPTGRPALRRLGRRPAFRRPTTPALHACTLGSPSPQRLGSCDAMRPPLFQFFRDPCLAAGSPCNDLRPAPGVAGDLHHPMSDSPLTQPRHLAIRLPAPPSAIRRVDAASSGTPRRPALWRPTRSFAAQSLDGLYEENAILRFMVLNKVLEYLITTFPELKAYSSPNKSKVTGS
ncbi:hypothetical protein U9M48_041774 [Paspalum notatum var. saurae]|uniref:Uncharacterized protein n=1 Tax=Paspalum notatum var. saurae TaxID=547442 RepID=A0AAQ3UP74_PASNO